MKLKYIFIYCLTLFSLFSNSFFYSFAYSKTSNIKLSVIIPVYNASIHLDKCLTSVINQTLSNIEIICINDGSTDNSLDILQKYSKLDKRIKIINQNNKGAANARNIGLSLAQGEYITFVDSDDTLELNAYEVSYQKAINQNVDILMFSEDKLSFNDNIYYNGFDILDIPGSMMLWNKLYRRSFIEENNFYLPDNLSCYHDECFNSIVLPKAKIIMSLSNKFYHYNRKNCYSIQHSTGIKKKSNNTLIYIEYLCKHWQSNNYITEHGFWILKKITHMINRNIRKLNKKDRALYYKRLIEIVPESIYNTKNLNKLNKFEKSIFNNWMNKI